MNSEGFREATESEKKAAVDRDAAQAELSAMTRAFDALHQLPYGARCRAMKWLGARLDNHGYDEEPPF